MPLKVVYVFREFQLDPGNQLLFRDGVQVALTPKVFSTLVLLVERAGQLVEKDESCATCGPKRSWRKQPWRKTSLAFAARSETTATGSV